MILFSSSQQFIFGDMGLMSCRRPRSLSVTTLDGLSTHFLFQKVIRQLCWSKSLPSRIASARSLLFGEVLRFVLHCFLLNDKRYWTFLPDTVARSEA